MLKTLNFIGPCNTLSYGYTTLNFLRELTKLGVKISYWPIGNIEVTNQQDANLIKSLLDNSKFFDRAAPCVRLYHQHDMAQFCGGMKIGFPIFELDTFTDIEKHQLSSTDKLFVCSQWAKDVIASNGIRTPTFVVPLGVDTTIFKPRQFQSNRTVFFNCGKWEVRKGHDILIGAFRQAFPDFNEPVQLRMMCDNLFNSPEETARWKALYQDPRVHFISRVNSQEDVYNIMSQTTCGVFPARAEGWNLEALEMMACGKEVIITNYSAHTEYCTSQNSYLLDLPQKEPAYDGKWFHGQGSWGKIEKLQVDQLAHLMALVHARNMDGDDMMNYSGIQTAQQFSWENAAKRMVTHV